MESKFFKVGQRVDITTPLSLRAEAGLRIAEVHPHGLVVDGNGGVPSRFFAFNQMVKLEFPGEKPKEGIKTTAGGK